MISSDDVEQISKESQTTDQPVAESTPQPTNGHVNFSEAVTGATWVEERPRHDDSNSIGVGAQPDFGDFTADPNHTNAAYSLRAFTDDTAVDPYSQLDHSKDNHAGFGTGAAIAGAAAAGAAFGTTADQRQTPNATDDSTQVYHDQDFATTALPPDDVEQLAASASQDEATLTSDARTLQADSMPLAGETAQQGQAPEAVTAAPEQTVTEYSSGPGKKPIRAAKILLAEDSTEPPSSTIAPAKPNRNKRLFVILTFMVLVFVVIACVAGYLFTRNSNSAPLQQVDGSLAAPKSGIALEGSESAAESTPPNATRLAAEDTHVEPLGISGATLKIETSQSLQQAVAYIEGQPQTEAQLLVWTRDENQDYVFRGPILPDQPIELTPENALFAIVAADAPLEEGALPPLFPGGEILVETIIWP